MFYTASLTTSKSTSELKSPFLIGVLSICCLYYGFRCYIVEESKNTMLILLFFLSLMNMWRSLKIQSIQKSEQDNSITVEHKGLGLTYLMLVLNILKCITEVWFKFYGSPAFFQSLGSEISFILTFTLNANHSTTNSLTRVILDNGIEVSLLLILIYIQKEFVTKIEHDDAILVIRFYKKISTLLRVLLMLGFFVESFFGNTFYIILIYYLMRAQLNAADLKAKTRIDPIISKLRITIIMLFFLRDIFVVISRLLRFKLDLNSLLDAFLDETFLRMTLFYLCSQAYLYLKSIRNKLLKFINYEEPESLMDYRSFQKTSFKRFFLGNILHVFAVEEFAYDESYTDLCIKIVKSYFETTPLIKKYTQELKRKKISHNYAVLTQLAYRVVFVILSLILKNFDVIFKFLSYASLIFVSATSNSYHTFELYDISFVIWGFITFVVSDENSTRILRSFAINIMFPCFIIGVIFTNFFQSLVKVKIVSTVLRTNSDGVTTDIGTYYNQHLYGFIPLVVYTVFQTLRESKSMQSWGFFRVINSAESAGKKGTELDYLVVVVKVIVRLVLTFSRYIALSIGIISSLVTVNLPNTLHLMATLFFFWSSAKDKLLWKYYVYYNIFFMSVLYLNQVIPSDLESFNFEFLSILGFSKQGNIYVTQFIFSFLTAFFASLYFRYMDKIEETANDVIKEEESKLLEELKNNLLFNKFERLSKTIRHFFVTYTVWIFHLTILGGMSYESGDFFSIALFAVDSLVFVVHLVILWRSNSRKYRNSKMLKWWYPSFVMVIVLICFRYLSFYSRYQTIRRMYTVFMNSSDPNQLFSTGSSFARLFLKIDESQKIDRLYYEFYLEILYLGASCLTLMSLSMTDEVAKSPRSPGSAIPLVTLPLPTTNTPTSPDDQPKVLENLEGNDGNLKATSGPVHSTASLGSVDQPKESVKYKRGFFLAFFSFFMLIRAGSFSFVVYVYQTNMDVLAVLFIAAELVYFNLLFWNLTTVFNVFQVEEFVTNTLSYFKRAFVDKINYQNALKSLQGKVLDRKGRSTTFRMKEEMSTYFNMDAEKLATKEKITDYGRDTVEDIEHNRFYLDQLLLKIEKEVTTISTYIGFLKTVIITMKGYFILAEFIFKFYSTKPEAVNNLIANNKTTMMQNTFFMGLILAELLAVKHYLNADVVDLPFKEKDTSVMDANEDKDTEEPVDSLSRFVVMLVSKLKYYSYFSFCKQNEMVNETQIAKEKGDDQDKDALGRNSVFFNLGANTLGANLEQSTKKTMNFAIKRKETFEDRIRSDRLQVAREDIWIREKADFLDKLTYLYRSFLLAKIRYQQQSTQTFDDTLGEYCFEEPDEKFLRKTEQGQNTDADEDQDKSLELSTDEDTQLLFGVGQGSPKLLKFLFMNLNTHKYKFAVFIESLAYLLRRAILLPLLYVVAAQSNVMNLPLLIAGILYSLRGCRTIQSDLKLFVPLFTIIFAGMFFGNLAIMSKNDNDAAAAAANAAAKGQQSEIAKIDSITTSFGGVSRDSLIVMSTFFSFVALSFSGMLSLVYFISEYLMVIRSTAASLFFWFEVERGRKVLKMDFLQWKTSMFGGFNSLYALMFDHMLDYYLVVMYLVSLMNPSVYNSLLLVMVLGMISSQMVPALKKYSVRNFSPAKIRNFTYIFNLVIYMFLLNYTFAGLIRTTNLMTNFPSLKKILDESLIAFLGVLVLNFSLSDVVTSDNFKEEKDNLMKKSELKVKFAALEQAYRENEEAIFARVKLITKLKDLDQIEQKFRKCQADQSWGDLQFDYRYWEKELITHIQDREAILRDKSLTGWQKFRTKFSESIYNYCHRRTATGFFQDFIYLLLQVYSKNRLLVKGGLINIEDYYTGDYSKYENLYKDITSFYHGLKNKETVPANAYKVKYQELLKASSRKIKKKNEQEARTNDAFTFKALGNFIECNLDQVEESTKDKSDLKKASNLLHSILLHDTKAEELNKAENEFMLCNFGLYRVKFFNLSKNMVKESSGYQVLRLSILIKMISQFLTTRLEYVVALSIIFLQIYIGGLENFFIIGIIFFCILIETHHGSSKWWTFLFNIYLAKCTVAYMHENLFSQSSGEAKKHSEGRFLYSVMMLLIGTPDYAVDAFILISIFMLNQVLRMRGFSESYLVEFEDPGSCIARLVINGNVDRMYIDKQQEEIEVFDEKLNHMARITQAKMKEKGVIAPANMYLKEKVSARILATRYEWAFYKAMVDFVKRTRNDLYEASFENTKSFMWRNFSHYVVSYLIQTKKQGKDRSDISFFLLMCALVFITYSIPIISDPTNSIIQVFSKNEIMSTNTFYIFLFACFSLIDGVINRKFSNDKTGLVRRPIIFNQLSTMQINFKPDSMFTKPAEKFRKAYRRLQCLFVLRECIKLKKDPIANNPLKRKFYFLAVFWCLVNFLVYFNLLSLATRDQNKGTFEILLTFFSDPVLKYSYQWRLVQIFYLLCICYMYISISQIHYGSEIFKSFVGRMSAKESLVHSISDVTPFYRETGVLMDFVANQSSLQLRHKLTFNDILYNIRTAKVEEIDRHGTSFGTIPAKIVKVVLGIGWCLLAVVILFGPLLPFTSIFNQNNPVVIQDASLHVTFGDQTGKEIGRLFETQCNIQSMDEAVTNPVFDELQKAKADSIRQYTQKNLIQLILSKSSETRPTIEDRFFSEIGLAKRQDIYNMVLQGSLIFRLSILLKNKKKHEFISNLKFANGREKEADELTNLLLSKCDAINVKRTIYLDKFSTIYQAEVVEEKALLVRPSIKKEMESAFMYTKLSINSVCDPQRRKLYSLFNDELDSNVLKFAILTYETQNSQDVIEKLVGFEIGVILLYVIAFRYLGVSLIKGLFFDKLALVWFTQIPEPEKILCLLDAIKYAQYEEDHLREELLFFMLIDIMRNPEFMKAISGSVHEKQLQVYHSEGKEATGSLGDT